jgi:hypothetical protein
MFMKRRWFQIHLSTAVVLMFVAGAMIWVNLAWTEAAIAGLDHHRLIGFPFSFYGQQGQRKEILIVELFLNLAFWSGLLTYIAFVCERRIRRREARKP